MDSSRFDALAKEYIQTNSPEARSKLISENKDLLREGVMLARKLEKGCLSPEQLSKLPVVVEETEKAKRAAEANFFGHLVLGIFGAPLFDSPRKWSRGKCSEQERQKRHAYYVKRKSQKLGFVDGDGI